jgi:hypothetical protein
MAEGVKPKLATPTLIRFRGGCICMPPRPMCLHQCDLSIRALEHIWPVAMLAQVQRTSETSCIVAECRLYICASFSNVGRLSRSVCSTPQ